MTVVRYRWNELFVGHQHLLCSYKSPCLHNLLFCLPRHEFLFRDFSYSGRTQARITQKFRANRTARIKKSAAPNGGSRAEGRGEFPLYPKSYDHEKQRVVLAAANELRKRGVKAFPDLVQAIDDKRYCCLEVGDEEESRHLLSVGQMSWIIIATQVDACNHAGIEYGDPQQSSVPYEGEKGNVKKWFKSRKDWTLGQFQKESVQLKQKEVAKFNDDSERKLILQQLDKMNKQLSQKGSYFEFSGGFIKVGDELLFDWSGIQATLKTKN